MVVVQRKRTDLSTKVAESPHHSAKPVISLSYETSTRQGSDRGLPIGSSDFVLYSTDTKVQKPALKRRSTYSFEKTERVRTLLWRAIYFFVVLIWAGAYRHFQKTTAIYEELLNILENSRDQSASSASNLANMTQQEKDLEVRLDTLQRVNHAFNHELRMLQETVDEDVDMHVTDAQMVQSSQMTQWIRQRKRALEHRASTLQIGLQEQSRQAVLEKYGPGPYQVKFKIKVMVHENKPELFVPGDAKEISSFVTAKGLSIKKDVIVELAPLDLMPHAIHLFLDLVSNKLWDDTVFLHNEQMEHLMAAAPIHYSTHNLKIDHLDSLPFQKLGFPEYSAEYPHKKYTLGFAAHGPTFYVNTMDNSEPHGPGGQGHHLLPNDADPCFGTITRGREVIDALVLYGTNAGNRLNPSASHPWKDQNLAWTRILSVDIM